MKKQSKQDAISVAHNSGPSAAEQWLEYYKPATEYFRKAWEGLTDDVLCAFIEDIEKGHGTFTRVAGQLVSTFPPLRALAAELSETERLSLLADLTLTLTTSVTAEYIRRVESAEN